MICPRCQNECADDKEFCNVCGNKLTAVKSKVSAPVQNYESDATTLLEDAPAMASGADETTLLDEAPTSLSYSEPVRQTVQPEPNNPKAQSTDYRYNPKQENGSKERIIVVAVVAVVAVIVIALLLFK
jgi:hypothetical protein